MKSVKRILFFGRVDIIKKIKLIHELVKTNLCFFLEGEDYV